MRIVQLVFLILSFCFNCQLVCWSIWLPRINKEDNFFCILFPKRFPLAIKRTKKSHMDINTRKQKRKWLIVKGVGGLLPVLLRLFTDNKTFFTGYPVAIFWFRILDFRCSMQVQPHDHAYKLVLIKFKKLLFKKGMPISTIFLKRQNRKKRGVSFTMYYT